MKGTIFPALLAFTFAVPSVGVAVQEPPAAAKYQQALVQAVTAPESAVPVTAPAAGQANTQGTVAPANKTSQKEKQVEDVASGEPVRMDSLRNQRKASKLYLQGVRLLEESQAEAGWGLLKEAAEAEPGNVIYSRAAESARQGMVTQLVQQATQLSSRGESAEAEKTLRHALAIDPQNESALQHLGQFADLAASTTVGKTSSTAESALSRIASGPIVLEPERGKHSFHLKANQRELVEQVFQAYGIDASVHESVQGKVARMDADDATFPEAMRLLGLVTRTFYEPMDPHRVVVATDTRENRQQFQRLQLETVYLPGLTATELTDVTNLARNVFDAQQAVAEPTSGTLTLRAPTRTLRAFNQTVTQLIEGKSQVDLNVKIIELTHIASKETGTTFLQKAGVFNAYSEVTSLINQNQALVQQVIATGLVPNADTFTNQIEILYILVASGQLTGTPFNQGFALFGHGLTSTVISPGPAMLTMSLNSSDARQLDDVHLRLGDQEPATIKNGERYPIEQSSFSSMALTALAGAGLSNQTVPQVQYEDLGLTLKATPRVMRSNDVALTLDLKIEALGGTSLNDIPILDSRQISGVITLKDGETAAMISDLNRQESRAMNGLPGISDIPGLQDIGDVARNRNVSKLLILVTPTIVRDMQQLAHGPMLMLDKSPGNH